MIYLAELLVVMANRLKIVRIRARNVLRVYGHKRLDDDASLAPVCIETFMLQESDGVARVLDAPGAPSC